MIQTHAFSRNLLSVAALLLFALMAWGSGESEKSAEEKIREDDRPPLSVSAAKLIETYEANEVAGDEAYKDRTLLVTGKVGRVAKDITDTMYVTINKGEQFEVHEVQAFFADSHVNKLAGLTKGQDIKVKCRCAGRMMNVLLKGCTIEQP